MKVERSVRTYFGGAAQRWQRLSGKGSFGMGLTLPWSVIEFRVPQVEGETFDG
jgi:hypothetical protein